MSGVSDPEVPTIEVMGVRMNPLTMEETLARITDRLDRGLFTQHAVVNVAKLVNMQTDDRLRESVLSCDLINVDGMGIVWGARFLRFDVPERVAGIDLFTRLLAVAEERGWSVFLLGARDDVVQETASRIANERPKLKIAGWHHGYFWDNEEAVVDRIRSSGANLLFVAITSPRKEQFINRWRDRLGVRFAMGVGGSFDVVAGKTRRAPRWMQDSGLEWFYRLAQEPRRMAKRYLVTNAKFAWMLARWRWSRSREAQR
jgi:N-acetylglucosaminyldiphosphoundecaprenol N-acetyl-beta-D-mannosaminyltransferase